MKSIYHLYIHEKYFNYVYFKVILVYMSLLKYCHNMKADSPRQKYDYKTKECL